MQDLVSVPQIVPHAIITEMSLENTWFDADGMTAPAFLKESRLEAGTAELGFERITPH
jgi:hypothetical protein